MRQLGIDNDSSLIETLDAPLNIEQLAIQTLHSLDVDTHHTKSERGTENDGDNVCEEQQRSSAGEFELADRERDAEEKLDTIMLQRQDCIIASIGWPLLTL